MPKPVDDVSPLAGAVQAVRPYGRRGHGRRQLVDSALSLVADRGLHAVRMRDLAAHARLSLGSTTYHFSDRAALLSDALDSQTTVVEDTMSGARECARLAPTLTVAVTEMTTALTAHYTDRDCVLIAAEIHLGATRDPAIADLAHRHRAALDSAITETYLYQGQPLEQARRHARITARRFWIGRSSTAPPCPLTSSLCTRPRWSRRCCTTPTPRSTWNARRSGDRITPQSNSNCDLWSRNGNGHVWDVGMHGG